jgi:hypothetical protein
VAGLWRDVLSDVSSDASGDGVMADCHRVCILQRMAVGDSHSEKGFEARESLRDRRVVGVLAMRRKLILEQVYR